MANTTIRNLLDLSISDNTDIVDLSTAANRIYVYEHIIAPLKFLAQGTLPVGYKFLGDDLADPFYNNIQTLLDDTAPGTPVGAVKDLFVKYYRQVADVDSIISESRSNTTIKGEDKDEFYLKVSINPITDPLTYTTFENMTVSFANNSELEDCILKNCKIVSTTAGDINFTNCIIDNCDIVDVNQINLVAGNTVKDCDIKSNIFFTDSSSKMYGCRYTTVPTNETYNLTMDFNVHISNL